MSQINGTSQVIKNLSSIEKNIVQEIAYGAQAVQAKVVNDARANCPTGVAGTLAQSIQPGDIIITDDNVVAFVDANADYASYVENGTRAHFPPVDALKDWAQKFLGDAKLAFVVARAISRRGTYAHPFLGPAVLANQGTFQNAIIAAVQRGIEGGAR
jgi:bacteriophage HK97-gp10 putative tail-component